MPDITFSAYLGSLALMAVLYAARAFALLRSGVNPLSLGHLWLLLLIALAPISSVLVSLRMHEPMDMAFVFGLFVNISIIGFTRADPLQAFSGREPTRDSMWGKRYYDDSKSLNRSLYTWIILTLVASSLWYIFVDGA